MIMEIILTPPSSDSGHFFGREISHSLPHSDFSSSEFSGFFGAGNSQILPTKSGGQKHRKLPGLFLHPAPFLQAGNKDFQSDNEEYVFQKQVRSDNDASELDIL